MGKMSTFLIIHFANALNLFQVLSTVQQIRINLTLSVRKTAPIHTIKNYKTTCNTD